MDLDRNGVVHHGAGFFAAEIAPRASVSTSATEYSLPHTSTGIGRWFAGPGADLLEENARRIAAQKSATADSLFANQQYKQALTLYRDACQADPEQPRFQFMAGISAWNSGLRDEAGIYLREAVRLEPTQPIVHHALAEWYLDHGDYAEALRHSNRAIELGAGDPQLAVCRASVLEASGKRREAWACTQRLLATTFRSAKLAALYARLVPGTGQEQAALNLIDQQIRVRGLAAGEQRLLRLAAAALLDRMRRFDDAFAFAQSGQACEPNSYNPAHIEQSVQRQLDYFTPAKLHELPHSSHGSRRPVFIIGMPRSGTSLVEQILASHPQVYGAGELPTINNIADSMGGRGVDGYPQCLDGLSVRLADKHAANYLRVIHELNATATFVTDKMPMNFLNLGIIATLFPDAHVIHCTRNALDTCISCYLTNFAIGNDPARNLAHLGAYYRHYRRLMQHWTRKLNFPALEVRYEAVVGDVSNQAHRMLDFLGLPWDDRCTAFHKTSRHVTTASRNQVNQPIYSTSVSRWRNYDKHLAPLRKAIGEWAD